MDKIKICFVSDSLNIATGSGRIPYATITVLQKKFDIKPIILIERGEEELLGAKAILFKKGRLRRFILNPLIVAFYSFKADIIYGFDGWPWGVYAYLASRISRKPFIMTLYGTYAVVPFYRRFQKRLMKATYDNCFIAVAISHFTAKKIKDAYSKARVKVINQGILFDNYQGPIVHKKIISNPYILTVAAMKLRKGYHISVPVFARLKKDFPDLKYVMLASRDPNDDYDYKIKKMIADNNLEKDVIWLTHVKESELIDLYKHAELFVLSSVSARFLYYFEGFGSIYLEAQSCGLPVIASRGGGQEDALIDGKTGFLAEEENIDDVYNLSKRILEDPELRREMSLEAKKFAKSMDWSNQLKDYYKIFQQILKR